MDTAFKTLGFIKGVTAAALVLFSLAAGWMLHDRMAELPNRSAETLLVADGGSPLSVLMFVAYQKTFFLTQGLSVHYTPYTAGRDALAALVNGKADLATVADTPIARAILAGENFRVVATIGTSNTGCAVLAAQGIRSPSELIGQKVGYVPNTNSEYFLKEFLIKHGIPERDISWVALQPKDSENALKLGDVAAVSVYFPFTTRIHLSMGSKVTVFTEPELYTFSWNLVASPRLLDSPDKIDRVMRALAVAEKFVQTNPDEAKVITAQYLRLGQREIDHLWPTLNTNIRLNQSLVVSLERQLLMQMGRKSKDGNVPDVTKFIYFDAMEAIFPNRVTIIR